MALKQLTRDRAALLLEVAMRSHMLGQGGIVCNGKRYTPDALRTVAGSPLVGLPPFNEPDLNALRFSQQAQRTQDAALRALKRCEKASSEREGWSKARRGRRQTRNAL